VGGCNNAGRDGLAGRVDLAVRFGVFVASARAVSSFSRHLLVTADLRSAGFFTRPDDGVLGIAKMSVKKEVNTPSFRTDRAQRELIRNPAELEDSGFAAMRRPGMTMKPYVRKNTNQTIASTNTAATVEMVSSASTEGPGSACRASVGVSTIRRSPPSTRSTFGMAPSLLLAALKSRGQSLRMATQDPQAGSGSAARHVATVGGRSI